MYILLKNGNTCNNKVFKEEYIMKRNLNLKKDNLQKSLSDKIILYSIIGVAILSIIIVAVLIYSNKVKEEVKSGTMSLEEMTNIIEDTQSASTQMGKTVNEAQNTNSSTKYNIRLILIFAQVVYNNNFVLRIFLKN